MAERLVSRHRATTRMLHAFSRWSVPASLELRLASHPSLDCSVPGNITVSLRLQCSAPEQKLALELCLAQFLSLRALLEAFWPHTEWQPVQDELASAGVGSLSCITILRRKRDVAITRPFVAATHSPGFGSPAATTNVRPAHAEHSFSWVPSWEDGSALLEALIAYPAPLVVSARVSNQAEAFGALAGLENSVETCERILSAGPSNQVALLGQVQLLRDAALLQTGHLGDGALRCELLLLSPGPADEGLAAVLGQYVTGDSTSGSLLGASTPGSSIPPWRRIYHANKARSWPARRPPAPFAFLWSSRLAITVCRYGAVGPRPTWHPAPKRGKAQRSSVSTATTGWTGPFTFRPNIDSSTPSCSA